MILASTLRQVRTEKPSETASHLEIRYPTAHRKRGGPRYVCAAELPGHESKSTFCCDGGKIVIRRYAYDVQEWNPDRENRCGICKYPIPVAGGLAETAPEEGGASGVLTC